MIQYAPYIADTIPAFADGTDNNIIITIPFSHNPAVNVEQISNYSLIIKELNSNKDVTIREDNVQVNINKIGYKYDNNTNMGKVIFSLSPKKILIKGNYYKFQLAYIDSEGTGPYSTVAVGRYIGEAPVLRINDQVPTNESIVFYGVCKGTMTHDIENLYSYRFKLLNPGDAIIQDTGEQLYNNLHQTAQIFEAEYDITEGYEYKIEYSITTINGYQDEITQIIKAPGETENNCPTQLEIGQSLKAMNNGYLEINITPQGNKTIEDIKDKEFIIERRRDGESRWEKLVLVTYPTQTIKDLTLEQGVAYEYSIKEKIEEYKYSKRNITESISIDFEDIYLSDNERQLKIRFDPKVSSLKNTILESKTDTIGSPYPFFFRNGTVKYKEIPISGLISYQMDEDDMFTNNKPDTTLSWMTAENVAAERKFKLEVLEWLNNGKPKLFRSPTEGNYMIRLMNVSLSPNDTLSRTIHSFSATGYEISPIDIQSLAQKYNIDYAISALGYFILGISSLGNGEE